MQHVDACRQNRKSPYGIREGCTTDGDYWEISVVFYRRITMKTVPVFAMSLTSLALLMSGCTGAPSGSPAANPQAQHADHGDQSAAAEREANISKLSAEDRQLAAAQGYCAVTAEPLGSMGPPLKAMINGQAVFLCCQGCEEKANSHPEETLAKVEELKRKVKSEQGNH
jgi:Cu(I)/Ag(I) efflux system membrane fusion protein